MVVIRLSRGGAKKRPFFNVVVADSRRAAGKLFIERIGFYDPKAPEGRESLRFATDRLTYWRGKGGQVCPTGGAPPEGRKGPAAPPAQKRGISGGGGGAPPRGGGRGAGCGPGRGGGRSDM